MARSTHFRLPALGRLALPPLVERELRAGARRPLFYWLRGLLALATGFQGYELLNHFAIAPPPRAALMVMAPPGPTITGATVLHQMSWLLFLATLLMGLVSADSITRERREGTLGLLLLTDLTPGEIVWGKMLSCGLTSFLVLLGALPALMFPVLAGGVTGSEAALIALGLVNTLFVALTAGLWMSALFRERRYAMPAALALIAGLAFVPEVIGGSYFGIAVVPFFRLAGLSGWMTAARLRGLFKLTFVGWFMLMHTVGWIFLWRAAVTLARNWQDQAHKQVREPEPTEEWPIRAPAPPLVEGLAATPEPAIDLARASWLTDPRPWDADPIRWRVERLGSAEGLIWLAVALNFLAQFGTLGPILNFGAAPADTWGFVSFVGMSVILFSGGLIAWAGARFFQDSRRQQDLELLLTTPQGSRHILGGQWCVLRRALTWPLGVVLVLALPTGISLLYDYVNDYQREYWSMLQPFLIAVNLTLEAVALCWVGIRFGLYGRNAITAVVGTVGLVQLLPLVLAVGLMWAWTWVPTRWSSLVMARGKMPPVILALLFFVAKNLALIVWARLRLRRELRLGSRTARLDASTSRLILQRA
jgi:ABC-type transport system involved in multi-copper enzyme maturation permease subunit